MDITFENEDSISLDLSKFHSLVDVAYVVKATRADSDEEAKVFKKLSDDDGSIENNGDGTYDVNFVAADFGDNNLKSDTTYSVYVGIKVTGQTKFKEIGLNDEELTVKADGIRA